jgi:hypothetical protein
VIDRSRGAAIKAEQLHPAPSVEACHG